METNAIISTLVTYAAVCARGIVHINPIRTVMGIEVLASVLVKTAASTHNERDSVYYSNR